VRQHLQRLRAQRLRIPFDITELMHRPILQISGAQIEKRVKRAVDPTQS
jgi:hypothetical protein